MRILYFYQYFGTSEGCWSTRVYEFTRRWVKAGDSVTVVTSVYDKSDLQPRGLLSRLDVEGVDVRVINVRLSNKHGIALRLFTFAVFAAISCWYALVLPADVVVASSGPITVGLPGLVARCLRRRRLVFEVRDLWPEGAIQLGILHNRWLIRLARRLEATCYRAASKVVALSDGQAAWIRERYAVKHLEVVPNAADNQLAEQSGDGLTLPEWAKGKRLAMYTGTLGLIDDCSQILEAARILQQRGADGVEIVLIGDGRQRPMLERKAQECGLRNVHFLGLVSKRDVMRWLSHACCALVVVKDVPFLATASPNKLFDAFAAGVPVVQVTQGWMSDLIQRERCGVTVPINDPTAMADAIGQLAAGQELRATLAANAARVARQLFDRDLLADRMRSILEAVAHEP